MENTIQFQALRPPIHTPESLRQRQRDRLTPRGRCGKSGTSNTSTTVKEVNEGPKSVIALSPAPRLKPTTGTRSAEALPKKQMQDGLRKENSIHRRAKREAEDMKSDIAPDGTSAGREGRQFTVAKVGNNGRIYLRYEDIPILLKRMGLCKMLGIHANERHSPTVRPTNQRYPQPPFVFPITPPSTAGLDLLASRNEFDEAQQDSIWTSSSPPTPAVKNRRNFFAQDMANARRRAQSTSTIDEQHAPMKDSDFGAFKVVIERPKTASQTLDTFQGIPMLDVSIPSFKLGTPRFSTKGTALFRASSITTNDDVHSSIISHVDSSNYRSHRPTQILSRRHSDASPQPICPDAPSSPFIPSSIHSPVPRMVRQRTPIVPDMFDALTFKPACDHPSVVRYSSGGNIKAATPARLVAEITSATFVDYDLLSDFFLTFRGFLDTTDLLYMLVARLKWALSRTDETGQVVRVRTFVAIRHWILNYFLDDFVIDYDLRSSFCQLLNDFVDESSQDATNIKAPLKILGELKKCWRRVCALYWDGAEFNTDLDSDIPIIPGGIAGSRDPKLDPSFWATHPEGPPMLEGIIQPDFPFDNLDLESPNYFADVSRAGHLDLAAEPIPVYEGTGSGEQEQEEPPLSPSSVASEDFVSCSFPTRGRGAGSSHPLRAHPVPASSIYDSGLLVASTPKALTGKLVRPTHKRSVSFSDSLRDQQPPQAPVQKVIFKSTELLLALPYAGSLVRGNLFPPGQPYVDVIAPSTPMERTKTTHFAPGSSRGPSAMSGPGMKKLLGSVRRALSTRAGPSPSASPTQGSFPFIPPIGVRGATVNRLPGTAVVPHSRSRKNQVKAPLRIDILGAEVADHFKRAVKEDADADAERREAEERERIADGSTFHEPDLHYSILRPDTTIDTSRPDGRRMPISEMTTGSKSIVIVDDTLPLDLPVMTGGLPLTRSSETFPDAFMHRSGGPTPPSTPPEAPLGIPRRTSELLPEHIDARPHSFEQTPSLIVDSRPSREEDRSPSHRPPARLAMRNPRSLSYSAKKSVSLRRYASFHSGFTRQRSELSFDATTFSESASIDRLSHIDHVPLPLRVLRRRPGGDLRAVHYDNDANQRTLRRAMSTGSLATYSESVRSSFLLNHETTDYVDVAEDGFVRAQNNPSTFSVGQMAEAAAKPASLFSTHSSQPVMRPSFEKEAQMLAQIPDDDDDDGGVESALLKLEGKFEQRNSDSSGRSQSQFQDLRHNHDSFGVGSVDVDSITAGEQGEKRRNRQRQVVTSAPKPSSAIPSYQPQQTHLSLQDELKPMVYKPRGMRHSMAISTTKSMESYNSTPLLERGYTDDGIDPRNTDDWSDQSILHDNSHERYGGFQTADSPQANSFHFIRKTDSLKRIPIGAIRPSIDQPYMDSESDDRSDLSSEMSLEIISPDEYLEENRPAPPQSGIAKDLQHPFGQLSPSITLVQALNLGPQGSESRQPYNALPPTPEITPTPAFCNTFNREQGASPSMDPLRANGLAEPSRKTSVHLPFILAFDSQILAQQFTLIEKDALNEIDWKDLIEMRWKHATTEARSWVEFLRTQEPRGVEVVIARFNIMVKWAVSECVLTQDLGERVRCLIKYIHIASHCRRYRNFATMTQLTVALTSKDLSRLTETWSYVPAAELRILKDLEDLVTPTANFYNLRAEMEGSGADLGCIPFVGIYTHDLLVNSERPSQVASTPTTDPLVNFERCRTDSAIIKTLLRLLEASQLYRFFPIEGVTERCLWMASLSDNEIASYSKMIQA